MVVPVLLDERLRKEILVDDIKEKFAEVRYIVGRKLLSRILDFVFLDEDIFISTVDLVENLIILEPIFEDFEKLGGLLPINLLDRNRQEVLNLREEARFGRPRPLLGDDFGVVLAKGLKDLNLFI